MNVHARVAVSALGGLVVLSGCGGGGTPAARTATAADLAPAAAVVHHPSARERSERSAKQVLAVLPVVPGTHRTSHGRRYGLGGPSSQPASSHLVDVSRVWAGRGSVADAKAYVAAHLPHGFTSSGSGEVSGPDGVESTDVDYDLAGRYQQPRAYTPMTVEVTYTQTGQDVGVRADVQTTWLSSRTPAQHLALDVTGVSISTVPHPDYRRSHQHRVHVTRGAADARRLVRALDHLPVAPSGTYSCPLQLLDDQTVLVLHEPGGDRRVTYEPTGCSGVTIPGGPALRPDTAFVDALHRVVRHR